MRLTIIPSDKSVCKNNICYSNLTWNDTPLDVHALQWFDVEGWVEFNNGKSQENIIELPQWALNAEASWEIENNQPIPDPLPPSSSNNQKTASNKLYETDWTTIPDVSDPQKSNPYLLNSDEFITYRNLLRAIAINPVEGYITWPTQPNAIWST